MTTPSSSSQIHSARVIITAVDAANQRIAWRLDSSPWTSWALAGERWQALSLTADGRTRYETLEVFSGIGAYVVRIFVGAALGEGVRAMAEGLKRRAED